MVKTEETYNARINSTIDTLREQVEDQIQILDSIIKTSRQGNPLYVIHRLAETLTALTLIGSK